jgi:NAD(P)H-dependent flavin oxidoreductase YrpB (nitropropane dioxygenase family)
MQTRATEMFGIDLPVFAFSHCRDVVAAVSKAGGLGVLGALAFSPDQLEIELDWIDEHVDGKPYGVDVVMPASYAGQGGDLDPGRMAEQLAEMIPQQHKDFIEKVLAEYDVPPLPPDEDIGTGLLGWTHEGARPQVDIALAHPICLLVNALGPPPKDIVDLAHEHGVKVGALIGSVQQAERQVNQGVDLVMAQGYEAGGHTGDVGVMVLVPEVVDAVGRRVPVLAAGGVGSGRQMAASMALGADGVWTGSIWLTTTEGGTDPVVIEKLLSAGSRDTVRSRAMTGKPARQLRTAWTDAWEREDSPGYLPMPLQYMATADAQRRIARVHHPQLQGMPVGQIVGRMNAVRPVRDVVFDLIEEFVEVTERLDHLRDDE